MIQAFVSENLVCQEINMKQRELVIEALEHRETRVIPYQIGFTKEAINKLITYTGDP